MVKGKTESKPKKSAKKAKVSTAPGFKEVPVGAGMGIYSTVNQQGQQIGWYIAVGGRNITIGDYTWFANTAYWFWWVGPFPDSFALNSVGSTLPSGLIPYYASPVTTSGPFDTGSKVTPATLSRWWKLSVSGGSGTIGAMGTGNGATQYWYQAAANPYLPVAVGQTLMFTPTLQPTNQMYQVIDYVTS